MKNKTIKYKISKNEDIGSIPYGAIILNAKIVCEGDSNDALVYFPRKIKCIDEDGEIYEDTGCGCMSFAMKSFDFGKDFWVRDEKGYINLETRDAKKHEI